MLFRADAREFELKGSIGMLSNGSTQINKVK
jgi:hypothetical protein